MLKKGNDIQSLDRRVGDEVMVEERLSSNEMGWGWLRPGVGGEAGVERVAPHMALKEESDPRDREWTLGCSATEGGERRSDLRKQLTGAGTGHEVFVGVVVVVVVKWMSIYDTEFRLNTTKSEDKWRRGKRADEEGVEG